MLNRKSKKKVFVSCEKNSRGSYTLSTSTGIESQFGQKNGVSEQELLKYLDGQLSSNCLYFVADSKTMKILDAVPGFQGLSDKAKQSGTTFAAVKSPANMKAEKYLHQLIAAKRAASILKMLNQSLIALKEEFPCLSDTPLKNRSQEYTLEDCKNHIGNLLNVLQRDVIRPAHKLSMQGEFDKAQYEKLKKSFIDRLEKDSLIGKLKNTANKLEPDTVLYDLHYAAVSFVRAFFRIFDVLATLFSKHTINDTPGRTPFFKLPEPPLSRRITVLMNDFKHVMRDLEDVYHNIQKNDLKHG